MAVLRSSAGLFFSAPRTARFVVDDFSSDFSKAKNDIDATNILSRGRGFPLHFQHLAGVSRRRHAKEIKC